MSARLRLSVAVGDYEITRPLKEGTVQPEGIELTVLSDDAQRWLNVERHREVDIGEMNAGLYFISRERGEPWIALPIFPHRRFRLGFIFVNAAKGIRQPTDLIGGKVGIGGYQPAAVYWMRGLLQDHFGVPFSQVEWVDRWGLLGHLPMGTTSIDDMLLEGELDGYMGAGEPRGFLRGDPRVVRLFPNFEEVEKDLYARTGIFPIMHTLTIKTELVERYPWVPINIARAFAEAKRLAYRRNANPRVMPLAFFQHAWEEQQRLLGSDPWAYGLGSANRKNLETMVRYVHEQGVLQRAIPLAELFLNLDESAFHTTGGGE